MKAKDKLRASWSKREKRMVFHYPLGSQTKCDAIYLSRILSDGVADVLEDRGYDQTTIKFSIEPKKGNTQFASQRDGEDK